MDNTRAELPMARLNAFPGLNPEEAVFAVYAHTPAIEPDNAVSTLYARAMLRIAETGTHLCHQNR